MRSGFEKKRVVTESTSCHDQFEPTHVFASALVENSS